MHAGMHMHMCVPTHLNIYVHTHANICAHITLTNMHAYTYTHALTLIICELDMSLIAGTSLVSQRIFLCEFDFGLKS